MSAIEEYHENRKRKSPEIVAYYADGAIAELQAAVAALNAQLREGRSHTRDTYPDFSHRNLRGELEQGETERWNAGWRARAEEGL